MTSFAATRFGDEPETPRWVEWRLLIYPLALGAGALALAFNEPWARIALFTLFAALMLLPLVIKARAWGGLGRLVRWLFFEKRLEVSREGWVFLVLTVLFGVAAINTGTNLLYLVLSMLLSLIVVSGMMSEVNVKGLRLARGIPQQIFAGEEVRLRIQVQNPRRHIPSFTVRIREMDFSRGGPPRAGSSGFLARLRPGESATLPFTERFERRGVYRLEGFVLSTRFPFGFFTKFAKAALPREVVVFPTPLPLTPGALGQLGRAAESLRARRRSFHPDEFRSLRPYRPGDNPRWIHWRSSARAGALVVKEFEPRTTDRAAVILDTAFDDPGREPTGAGGASGRAASEPAAARRHGAPGTAAEATAALDRGTTLCASFVEHLARLGQRPEVAVLFPAHTARFGQEGGARAGLALLDALARAEPTADPGFDRLREAARPALASGARVYVLSARDPAQVRHALERADPAAAFAVELRGFRDEAELARWVVPPPREARDAPSPATPTSSTKRARSRGAAGAGAGAHAGTEREGGRFTVTIAPPAPSASSSAAAAEPAAPARAAGAAGAGAAAHAAGPTTASPRPPAEPA